MLRNTLWLGLSTLLALTSAPAWSAMNDAGSVQLPSDLGPVSIDGSRRAIQARITDWKDDVSEIGNRRLVSCGLAAAEGFVPAFLGPLPSLLVLASVPSYLNDRSQAQFAARPLGEALADMEKDLTLTAPERSAVERLMARETPDVSDRIRLAIDTETFLMQVSNRLYQEQMDAHLAKTTGLAGFFRFEREYCSYYALRTQRDHDMAAAAVKVLDFYNSLEREIQD